MAFLPVPARPRPRPPPPVAAAAACGCRGPPSHGTRGRAGTTSRATPSRCRGCYGPPAPLAHRATCPAGSGGSDVGPIISNMFNRNQSEDCIYLRAERVRTNSPVTPTKRINGSRRRRAVPQTTKQLLWSLPGLPLR
eukprot:1175545-Prorocentrum_minimum.AAC.2